MQNNIPAIFFRLQRKLMSPVVVLLIMSLYVEELILVTAWAFSTEKTL
jgi:hypothetical protein